MRAPTAEEMLKAMQRTYTGQEFATLQEEILEQINRSELLEKMATAFGETDAMAAGVVIGIAIAKSLTQ